MPDLIYSAYTQDDAARQQFEDIRQQWPFLRPQTALPANPVDGQEGLFQNAAMAAQGIIWRFRYNAASASAYKWEFMGGPAWYAKGGVGNPITPTTSAAVVDFINGSPIHTLPLGGDYLLTLLGTAISGAAMPARNVYFAFSNAAKTVGSDLTAGTVTLPAASTAWLPIHNAYVITGRPAAEIWQPCLFTAVVADQIVVNGVVFTMTPVRVG